MGGGIRPSRAREQELQGRSTGRSGRARSGSDTPMVRRAVVSPWFVREPSALETLRSTLRAKYPTLHAEEVNQKVVVRGSLPITDQGAEIDWYLVEIVLPDDYPGSPSLVRETGGRIPRVQDR